MHGKKGKKKKENQELKIELKTKIPKRNFLKTQSGGRYDLLCFYYFNTFTFTFLLPQANGHVA